MYDIHLNVYKHIHTFRHLEQIDIDTQQNDLYRVCSLNLWQPAKVQVCIFKSCQWHLRSELLCQRQVSPEISPRLPACLILKVLGGWGDDGCCFRVGFLLVRNQVLANPKS